MTENEKKLLSALNVIRHHELSRHIAELTEDLEELKSEKGGVLHTLDCADDAAVSAVKKDIFTMEASLKKLDTQEEKYAAELEDALREYVALTGQAAEMDADSLMDARLTLRPEKEHSAVSRIQTTYCEKYEPQMMADSKRDVADLLDEDTETRGSDEINGSAFLQMHSHLFLSLCNQRKNIDMLMK